MPGKRLELVVLILNSGIAESINSVRCERITNFSNTLITENVLEYTVLAGHATLVSLNLLFICY